MAAASESFFQASDGAQVFVRRFQPPEGTPPKAVVHVHHGLGEHTGRYVPFALRLAKEGFVVVAHDSRAQGQTATAEGAKGYGKVEPGKTGVVPRMQLDFEELLAETHKTYPDLRIFLFGHSFGTVMCQITSGAGAGGVPIAGVALSAPPARIPAAVAPINKMIIGTLHSYHGDLGCSKIPEKLTFDKWNSQTLALQRKEEGEGAACRCFSAKAAKAEEKPTGYEWLNRDKVEVQKFADDPSLGAPLCMAFWKTSVPAVCSLSYPSTYAKLSKDTPVLVLAGDHDFCTMDDFGTPSYRCIQKELAAVRHPPPKVIVYPGARHELLLELCKQEVMDDVVTFYLTVLRGPPKEAGAGADVDRSNVDKE